MHFTACLVGNRRRHSDVMSLDKARGQQVSVVAATGMKCRFFGTGDKGLQADAIGPIDGTVALGLDYGLLGGPCDDVGG